MNIILSTPDDLIIKLLRLDAAYDKVAAKYMFEESELRDAADTYASGVFDAILDSLGVPPDNTIKTNACDVANVTGAWPWYGFCRDSWVDKWRETAEGTSGISIEQFPDWVRESVATLHN